LQARGGPYIHNNYLLYNPAVQMVAAIEWRWEWVLFLAFAVAGLIAPALRRLKRRAASQWPTTQGAIDSVDVQPTKQLLVLTTSRSRATSFRGQLVYSYSVQGNNYSGHYDREFGSEVAALEFVRDLKAKPVVAHYNERNAAKSALAEQDVETLLRTRAPAPDGGVEFGQIPGWAKPLLLPLIALAAVGFCVSVYFHIDTFLRHRAVPEPLFSLLHIGIFVVWFPAMLIAQKRGALQRKDFWKALLKDAPDWLYLVYAFSAYTAVMDSLTFFVFSSSSRQTDPVLTSTGFSATWMMFYLIGFTILYGAARVAASGPKCLNGHPPG
jgi:uncharacterized protein DUF3592